MEEKTKKMNKKGLVEYDNMMFIFGFVAVILVLGLVIGLIFAPVKTAVDDIVPAITGAVAPVSQVAADKSTAAWTGISNSLPWLLGAVYFICFIGIVGMAYSYRVTGNRVLVGLYLGLTLLIILLSILVSNSYQSFHETAGDIGTELQGAVLFSWLMLYSPVILSVIMIIAGLIMFGGFNEEVRV